MKTKHTPAPWKVRYMQGFNPESGFFVEAKNNNKPELGYGIEIMGDDYGDHNGYPIKQREADAKLIAAAPDLLEALLDVVKEFGDEPLDWNKREAIDRYKDLIKRITE